MSIIALLLPASAFIALQSSKVQTYVSKKVLEFLSENLKTEFSVEKINMSFFNRIVIKKLYIQDQRGDTLIYSDKLTVNISRIKPKQRKLTLNQVSFQNAFLNLYNDSSRTINIKFLADRLAKKGNGEKNPWDIEFRNVELIDSRFNYKTYDSSARENGINFTDMQVRNLNIDARRFKPKGDTLRFIVNNLDFTEKSGFILSGFSSHTSICRNHFIFEDVFFKTPYSSVDGKKINLYFSDYSDFKAEELFDSVKFDVNINESIINFVDLSYFVPAFSNAYQGISFSGDVKGAISNLSGKNIRFRFGNQSKVTGEFSLNGLPEIKETFIYAKLKELQTDYEDLYSFVLPGNKKISIPEMVRKMNKISYKGEFTGFINDFVAYGSLKSNLGTVKTDLLLKPDSANKLSFNGSLETRRYKLGLLLDNQDIGNISMKLTSNGWISSKESVYARLDGKINNLEYKEYDYNNINITGLLQDNTYNGDISINDPNINFNFNGFVDFSKQTARYNFMASVGQANLYALNIDKTDPDQTVSFDIKANAKGNTLNDITGEVKLINSLFIKKDKQIQVYDIDILASDTLGEKSIKLRSDFMDADITGNFEIDKINGSFRKFLFQYLPALVDSGKTAMINDFAHGFKFDILLKNTKSIFDFFLPDYYVGDNTKVKGEFTPSTNQLIVNVQSPVLKAKGTDWNNIYLNILSNDSVFTLNSGSENLSIKNKINLENFTVYSNTRSDTIGLLLRWNNWDSTLYRGSLKASLNFKHDEYNKPFLAVNLIPTKIITYDTLWNINKGEINIQKNNIVFNNILINHKDQFFKLYGKISENPEDQLHAEFHDFNLENITTFIKSSRFDVKGILDGKATVSSLFDKPIFYSSISIDTLVLNNEKLGYTSINSQWKNSSKSILLDAYTKLGSSRTLSINGEYFPLNNGKLDFDISFDKLKLAIVEPYIQHIANGLKGQASGNLKLEGTINKPLFNGDLLLQNTAFTIDYLKTQYYFTNNVKIANNNVLLDNIRIYDQYGKQAVLNGTVSNNYFRNFRFNLSVNADDFHLLNTTQNDNNQFYGTAFASGIIKISGSPKNINMDIIAKTERNTRFFIPLSGREEISEYNFVSFSLPDQEGDEKQDAKKYQVNLGGIQMNFDLEVTPDAEVQIIFDPTVGDILEGKGYGNLKLQINTLGKFNMYGSYIVEEGDYLFTMLNLFNRKFNIEYGGTISWNGSPLNAEVNLNAIYRTKASLSGLFGTTIDSESGNGSSAGADEYRSKTTVDCKINMSGKLLSPNIKYSIYLPNSDETVRDNVSKAINNSDELIKQFSSLLVMNSFLPQSDAKASGLTGGSPYGNAAGVNASELLSNQLSHWLSQINNNVDIGVNYRTDKQIKSDEVELALSMLMFNDRLTIYGNVDVPTNATKNSSSNIVGDVDLDYKITKNGKIRVKAFNHSNENIISIQSPYTQGFGFVFKEEFNSFGELWRRYWLALTGEENKKKKSPPLDN